MIERLVAFSVQRRWLVIALVALATVASAGMAAHLFRINTDVERLIDKDVPWRQDEIAYEKAFPQRTGTLVAVIDGKSPEEAEEAAANLAKALADRKDTIESVYRPDGGPFYEKNGFLLLSQEELTKTTEQLVQQQGLLGPLAADPSLRGIMRVLSLGAKGVKSGDAKIEDLDRPMGQIDETLRTVLAGEPARLSWQTLLSNGKLQSTDLRKFVMIQPVLDYNALQPGATATAVVRKIAADLKINNGEYHVGGGARMRLTGPVAVADDEFATLAEDAFVNYSVTTGAIVLFVWLALRSASLVGAVLITTFAGLIVTAALGLLMVGELNPISVAFAALFVGLGIDFGIQFAVRYRADRFEQPDLPAALRAAARGVGWSLTLAAISLIAGFFAFLPTAFRGVSELGLIAGVGMIVAYLFSLTLLPALIAVFKPKTEAKAVETTWMAGVDHWIIEHRKAVLIGVGLVTVAGIPLLFKLPFDSNPMHLRSPKVESISTYLDLIKDPETSPNLIDVLAPSPEAVPDLAAKLRKLPSVAKVIDIDTFVPRDQDQKLAIIADTAQLLGPALNPGRKPPPPTDADNVKAIKDTAAALRTLSGARTADALAGTLDKLASAPVATREAASVALTTDLKTLLTRLGGLLNPQKITLANLPPKLKAEWVTADGRSRIEVHPSGDANDNVVLRRFAKEVQTVAPHATGAPVATTSSSYTILGAFVQAALTALVLIFIILSVALRKPWDVAMTLGPLVLATLWTLMALHVVGMPLNFANIIAMPLMLAVGVAFHIYYVIAWRAGVADMLASSLTRAIFFSALTTGTAFGSLVLSSHPGTASMGKLLALSLFFTLVAAFFVVPAFLGPPPKQPDPKRPEGDAAVPPDLQARRPAEVVAAK